MPRSRIAPTLAALAALLWAAQADASGFATARFGGEYGYPLTNNPTAVYYNPAGLAQARGYHLFLDASLALRQASYDHNPGPTDTGPNADCTDPECDAANNGEATLSNVLASPMFGASAQVLPHTVVGAGWYVPFGGVSIWDKNDVYKNDTRFAGPYDSSARWYSINGTIKSTYMTLALAQEIPSLGLNFGASINAIQSVIDTIRARTADGAADITREGRSYVNASGWQVGFGVGAIWEVRPERLWVGASYQSRPNVSGGMHLKGTIQTKLGPEPSEGPVSAYQDLPDIVRLGVRMRPNPRLEVRAFGDYTRWSAFKSQCIADGEDGSCEVNPDGSKVAGSNVAQNLPRNWQDAFGMRVGVTYWTTRDIELMVGTGYDSNAIPDKSLDPALMDFHDISVAIGGRFHVIEPLYVAATATHFFYISRDTTGESENATYVTPSRSPDAGGEYSQSINVLNINVEAVF